MKARRRLLLVTASLCGALLSGCAYKPLKAPCSPDEGTSAAAAAAASTPLAYAPTGLAGEPPAAFANLGRAPASSSSSSAPAHDHCGPMRPI